MKLASALPLIALLIAGPLFSQDAAPAQDIKIKVRWAEKKVKTGKHIITIFVKNEGGSDLANVNAQITIKGSAEYQRQKQELSLTVGKNIEKAFDIEILVSVPENPAGGFTVITSETAQPVGKVVSVKVSIGSIEFPST